MLDLGIILGSTRPNRHSALVGDWVAEQARAHPRITASAVSITTLDLRTAGLPLLDEPLPPMAGEYTLDTTRAWAERIAHVDAYVFIAPEYNHSIPGGLKNAIDHLFAEWNDKAAGIVSYGANGGVRSAEHLRQVLGEVKVATVREQPALSVYDDFVFDDTSLVGRFTPRGFQYEALAQMLDEVLAWGGALRAVREQAVADAA